MSFPAMTWARTVSFGSPIRKAIAYTLADHHNGDSGRCDPGIETIAREADASVRATEINLRWMERVGVLTVLRRQGRPNCYVLNFAWGAVQARPTCQQRKHRPPAPDAGAFIATPAFECVPAAPTPAPDAPEPEREDSTGRKEERAAPASPPPPAPSPYPVEIFAAGKEASGIEAEPVEAPEPLRDGRSARKTPLPDDWAPPPEVRQLAIAAGFDPDELIEEMADWARAKGARSADWAASMRSWIRRERKFGGRRRGGDTLQDQIARRLVMAGALVP
jgi:hypothetical protein